jgi:3-hydroxyisobutyrate dehydrogenase
MKVGFIGLGTMGGGMALNLRKAGYDLMVHDLRREAAERHIAAGCEWSDTAGRLAEACEVVFTSLPGPTEIEAVALGEGGLLTAMKRDSAWIDLSTSSPTLMRAMHDEFAARDIAILDAPVSGGPAGADSGRLAIWAGGDEAVFNKYRPLLDAIGDQVRYIGPIGAGTVAKLVHNMTTYALQAVLAEVFTLGVKAGLDPLDLWAAVRDGATGRKRTFDRLAEAFLPRKYDPPMFALSLAHKDVTLAVQLGNELGVPMRLCDLARDDLTEALNRGWGHRDSRIGMLIQEERAGVHIEVPAAQVAEVLSRDQQ